LTWAGHPPIKVNEEANEEELLGVVISVLGGLLEVGVLTGLLVGLSVVGLTVTVVVVAGLG